MAVTTEDRRRFDVGPCIGSGGFGEVYLATMVSAGGVRSEVALKVLHRGLDPRSQAVQRLADEAKLLGLLNHPNILRVHDLVLLDGRITLVTEYIPGLDLDQCVLGIDEPLGHRALLQVTGHVAAALHTAYHTPGPDGEPLHLLHRDIKPSNIRVGRHGEVKLLDFGIAKAAGEREAKTQTNALIGSFSYMSPERLDREGNDDAPGDVFSLGCALFEMLKGDMLFDGTIRELYRLAMDPSKHAAYVQANVNELDVDPALHALLLDLLAYEASARPPLEQLAERCEDLADDLPGQTLSRWCRSRDWGDVQTQHGELTGQTITEASLSAEILDRHATGEAPRSTTPVDPTRATGFDRDGNTSDTFAWSPDADEEPADTPAVAAPVPPSPPEPDPLPELPDEPSGGLPLWIKLVAVLAIGLLVDDAIVVVENVERVMEEDGLSPLEATRKSMDQITGALIGIALVLSAVFVPMAFFGGATGAIYRQFSITIVSAMALSVLVALTLSPALCATMLKAPKPGEHTRKGFFGWFNRRFDQAANGYQGWVGKMLRRGGRMMVIYLLIVGVMALMFTRMPSSFLPDEDQGTLIAMVQLPPGATLQRTEAVMREIQTYFNGHEDVEHIFTIAGFSFAGAGQNSGMAFVRLKDWSERPGDAHGAQAIAGQANGALSGIRDANIFVLVPPPIRELGTASGFDVQLVDLGGVGHEALMDARNQFLGMAAQRPELTAVRPNGLDDTPQFKIDIDAAKAGALGLSMDQVNAAMSTLLGGQYVNDFVDGTRVKRVYVQADAQFRMLPEDIGQFHVRNASGDMVPLSTFSSTRWIYGSPRLERYNGNSSVEILGSGAPGVSSGEAMDVVEELMRQMPEGIGYEWTGLSYQERLSGSQAPALYALSMLVVFLCLAALYESWVIPFAVMLVVPLGVIGALAAAGMRGLSSDVYFQVGLLTTIGLSAKNAILIVEFARDLYDGGMSLLDATMEAVRMRLRPIIMTSLAFMLGVLPLALSTGAGSASQNAIGTGVFGGMASATLLGIFFTPVFFVVVNRIFSRRKAAQAAPATEVKA